MQRTVAVLAIGLLAACGADDAPPVPEEVTKDDIARQKADQVDPCASVGLPPGCDICDALGWYGDGDCDRFCALPDEDCGPGAGQPPVINPGGCGGPTGQDCAADEYCHYAVGSCRLVGTVNGACQPLSQVCGPAAEPSRCADLDPAGDARVCGCDGRTYENACGAARAGQAVDYCGVCSDCTVTGCAPGFSCQSCWQRWACIPEGATC